MITPPDDVSWWDHLVAASRALPDGRRIDDAVSLDDLGGDSHTTRFPLAVTWADGERWVYKPRHSWMESFLPTMLERVWDDPGHPWMAAPVLTGEDFSWSRVVEPRPAASRQEVELFYRRSGCLLAVSQYLRLGDINHENVIANGAHPVLVDAEVFLRPTLDRLLPPARVAAAAAFERSPLGTAYLPLTDAPAEPSALGIAGGSRDQVGVWRPSHHLPELAGRRCFPDCFADEVLEGYHRARALLPTWHDAVSSALREATASLRVMVRGTAEYGAALRWFAAAGRDERAELVPRLEATLDARGPLALHPSEANDPSLLDVVRSRREVCELEAVALREGLVPLFLTRLGERRLTLAATGGLTSEVMSTGPWEQWLDHARALLGSDADADAALVRTALGRHDCRSLEGVR